MRRTSARQRWAAAAPLLLLLLVSCVDLTYPGGVAVSSDGGPDVSTGNGDGPRPDAPVDTGNPPGDSDNGPGDDPIGNGGPCLHGGQCASGFCVEGVCCSSACDTSCHSCRVTAQEGSCVPVPAGQDPGDHCTRAEPNTCQQDGFCDGAGACRRYAEGSECLPASCSGATEHAASTCDGNGTCRPGASRSCAPSACLGGSCGSACSNDSQCLTGFFCAENQCVPKRALSVTCTADNQCASGACADGVCCASACSETCHACNLAGTAGSCVPVPAGSDPRDTCPTTAAGTCGTTGVCNGQGACALHQAGTTCAAGSCSGNTETPARTCNGLGTCVVATARACAPYICGPAACRTTCTGATDCQSGFNCSAGSCVATAPDAGGGGNELVLDNFNDGDLRSNTFGGTVTWDNANVTLVGGEQKFVWNGNGIFSDLIETFRNNWCEHNLSAYTKVRMRLRASVAGKRMIVYIGIGTGSCGLDRVERVNTLALTTTMTTYDVDITSVPRNRLRTVELAPTTNDGTEYFVDDIVLVP